MNHLEKIKQVFDQASDLPREERAALLDVVCAGDGLLRAEVEELLNTEAADFLASPILPLRRQEPQPRIGRVIDRYRLLSEIGRGGMAMVYLAERIDEYQQQVALKLVWPSADSGEITRRFRQERQILARLDHPNIARLFDGGTTSDGWPYLVMEYIAGEPITHYCRAHQLTLDERLRLFQTVCNAVAYAHRNLVVHRDIKPLNILVTEDGVVKLLDFGIAKLLALETSQQIRTSTGLRLMTPEYASPEQIREEEITTASDVYSLGVLLYELLTGAHPHELNNLPLHEIIRVVCDEDPPPPSARAARQASPFAPDADPRRLQQSLRGDLDKITLTALRKDPQARYASAARFGEDIGHYLQGEPVVAREATLAYHASRYVKRHRTGVAMASLIFILLLSFIGYLLNDRINANRLAQQQRRQRYALDMTSALQAWQENDMRRMGDLLEEYLPKPDAEDLRGFEWRYLWRLAHQEERSIKFPETILGYDSLQNSQLVLIHSEHWIKIFDVTTWQERLSLPFNVGQQYLYLREGEGINLFENGHEINIYDVNTGQRVNSFQDDGAPLKIISSISEQEFFTLDDAGVVKVRDKNTNQIQHSFQIPATTRQLSNFRSSHLVSVDSTNATLWDMHTGQPVFSFKEDGEIKAVSVTKDRLSVYIKDGLISLRDLHSGRLLAKIGGGQGGISAGKPSSDEKFLVTGGVNGSLKLWDTATGLELETLPTRHQDMVRYLHFSPDGKWMASVSNDRTIKLWDAARRREVATLKGHANEVSNISFFSDSRRFMSLSDTERMVKVWDLANVLQPAELTGHSDYIYAVAVSPDNRHIATASKDKTAIIWDSVTGAQRILRGHTDQVFAVAYSPDGKWLATGGNDGTVRLWDTASVESFIAFNNLPAQPQYGVSYAVRSLAFTPDGSTLLIGNGDGTVKYWDWATRSLHQTLSAHDIPGKPEHEVVSMRFSPNGKMLATASMEGTAKIWDVATGSLIATLTGHEGYVWAAVFSPDGKLLATCSHDRTIKLWDTATWREVATMTGHSDEVFSVAFTPDGKRLASASNDDTVRLWDVERRQEVLTIKDNTDQVWSVAFTPDGQTMVTGSWDKTVRLYRAATDQDLLKHARK